MPSRGKISEITTKEAYNDCKTRGRRTNTLPLRAGPRAANISAGDALIEFDADDEDSDFEPRESHLVLGKFDPTEFAQVIVHKRFFEILNSTPKTCNYTENDGFLLLLTHIRGRSGEFPYKILAQHRLMLIDVVKVIINELKCELFVQELRALSAAGVHERDICVLQPSR